MFPGLILHKTQKQNTHTKVAKKPWAPPGPWLLALPVGPRWLHLPLVYAAISATHRASNRTHSVCASSSFPRVGLVDTWTVHKNNIM